MAWHPQIPSEFKNAIITGDARELAKRIPDGSISLIFTDPPYPKEYLYLYEWLAEETARILKPMGFLLVYTGIYSKDKVMSILCKHLEYFFDLVLVSSGNRPIIWPRAMISAHKSILVFRRQGSSTMPQRNVISLWNGGGEDKRYHTWGQDESSARYYIDCFSAIGDVVLDPFAGGGTTVAMCKILQRNYVSFEIDPAIADIARKRVTEQQMPLLVPEVEQMLLEVS